MLKVLQINAVYGFGSTGVITKDIQDCCLENGIDCYVGYSQTNLPKSGKSFKIGCLVENKLHALLYRIDGRMGYYSYFSTLNLIKKIKKIKPDIIHLHNLHGNYVNLPLLLKFIAKNNIALVITLHDCWFYTGGCFHYTFDNCFKWLEECGNCPKRYTDLRANCIDSSAKVLKDRKKYFGCIPNLTVVGVSQWIASEAKRTFFNKNNVLSIYNGIDTNIFRPYPAEECKKEFGLDNKNVILGPGSKWLQLINRDAFDYIINNLPDDSVFVIFGTDNKTIINKKVKIIPYISNRQELARLYSAADVFVNCTREESMSLINVEVQSCGTPVVTYSNTGAAETVDNICSFRIDNNDYREMMNNVLYIITKGKRSFSQDCRKFILNQFNVRSNYLQYINLYKHVKQN